MSNKGNSDAISDGTVEQNIVIQLQGIWWICVHGLGLYGTCDLRAINEDM
jgi:hypothetical protein